MKRLRNIAIGLLTMLFAGSIFALDLPVKNVNGKEYYYYAVTRGETVISIANKIGVTRDDIIKHNPGAADGVRQGSTLFFPVSEFRNVGNSEPQTMAVVGEPFTYRVQRGETLFGLSHRFGVTPESIIELNPSARNGIKPGMDLLIPNVGGNNPIDVDDNTDKPGITISEQGRNRQLRPVNPEVYPVDSIVAEFEDSASREIVIPERNMQLRPIDPEIYPVDTIEVVSIDTLEYDEPGWKANIGLMLPLMLNETDASSKNARMTTEFIRGFMLGLNSMDSSVEDVNVYIYDTEGNPGSLAKIMSKPEIDSLDVVIGPTDNATFTAVVDSMSVRDAMILNVFAAQDTTYMTNENVVQCNVPHDVMYDKAIEAILSTFEGYTPVFLISKGGKSEKINFTDRLRAKYAEKNIEPVELMYQGMLTSLDLEKLDSLQNYVFIPSSGALSEFNKFSRAIRHAREQALDPTSVALIGYPDWTTFRGEALENLHALGAVIYSRFYADANDDEVKAFASEFTDEYGSPMMDQVPSQALLGYDVARYLLSNLRENDGEYDAFSPMIFRGLQSSYMLMSDEVHPSAGSSNRMVYIITFQEGNDVSVQVI